MPNTLRFTPDRPPRHRPARFGPEGRRGAIVLEFMLALPILIFVILAIVEFGIFHARMQQVALGCRVGAEEASQTAGLDTTTDGDPVPAAVLDAIDHQLESSGITRCKVRLEHNVGGEQAVLVSPTSGACDCGPEDNLTDPLPAGQYVRLTLCVPMRELMPNSLCVIGYDITGRTVECTSVFRYELVPPP